MHAPDHLAYSFELQNAEAKRFVANGVAASLLLPSHYRTAHNKRRYWHKNETWGADQAETGRDSGVVSTKVAWPADDKGLKR